MINANSVYNITLSCPLVFLGQLILFSAWYITGNHSDLKIVIFYLVLNFVGVFFNSVFRTVNNLLNYDEFMKLDNKLALEKPSISILTEAYT